MHMSLHVYELLMLFFCLFYSGLFIYLLLRFLKESERSCGDRHVGRWGGAGRTCEKENSDQNT